MPWLRGNQNWGVTPGPPPDLLASPQPPHDPPFYDAQTGGLQNFGNYTCQFWGPLQTLNAAIFASGQPWTDVLAYGADPSATLNSAPAINSALGNGGVVFIPPGSYLLNSSLLIPSNTALLMTPASVLIQNTTTAIQNLNSTLGGSGNSNITISGGQVQLSPLFSGCANVFFQQVTSLNLSNMTISGASSGNAVSCALFNVYKSIITNMEIDVYANAGGGQNNGIWIQGGDHNVIGNCNVRSGDDCYAVGFGATLGLAFTDTFDISINNCIGDSRRGRIFVASSGNDHNVYQIAVSNLTGKPDASGVSQCISINNLSSGASTTHHINIDNCVLDSSSALVGVTVDGGTQVNVANVRLVGPLFSGGSSAQSAFQAKTTASQNTTVQDVKFAHCSGTSSSTSFGGASVQVSTGGSADNISFIDCDITGHQYGVLLNGTNGPVTHCRVIGCDIRHDTGVASGVGVGLNTTNTADTIVQGNQISTYSVGVSESVLTQANFNIVTGNDLRACTAEIGTPGANSVYANNM